MRALILVENTSVPSDPRVWPQCRSLTAAGWDVTVVSPRGETRDLEREIVIDGVAVHRFDQRPSGGGAFGYLKEYGSALGHMSRLVRRLSRRAPFDVIQACTPPDILLLSGLAERRRGTATILDHHDLSPELYAARGGRGAVRRGLAVAERLGFRLADVVLATNESFRDVALTRGGKEPDDVFVVRNGPDPEVFRAVAPDPEIRAGATYLIGYAGMIGPQDGVLEALHALAHLRRRRTDWRAVFIGDGDGVSAARDLARRLELDQLVEFVGFVHERPRLVRLLSSCDVCISPEPRNALNERSTLIKVAEYMALSRPVVAFNLTETRRTAAGAAAYAAADDPDAFAATLDAVISDPVARQRMGAEGRERVDDALAWRYSERALLAAYARAIEKRSRRAER